MAGGVFGLEGAPGIGPPDENLLSGGKASPFEKSTDTDCPTAPVVRIIGAGISGLTVAHELVLRGFSVQVIEPNQRVEEILGDQETLVHVGGVARTQYALWNAFGGQPCQGTFNEAVGDLDPLPLIPVTLDGITGNVTLDLPSPFLAPALDPFVTALRDAVTHLGGGPVKLRVRLNVQTGRTFQKDWQNAIDLQPHVQNYLSVQGVIGGAAPTVSDIDWEYLVPPPEILEILGNQAIDAGLLAPGWFGFIAVDIQTTKLPGEHGYRFFPSFYTHVFDTMRRTPLYDAYTEAAEPRTVYDNLNPTTRMGLGLEDHRDPMVFNRKRPGSVTEAKELLDEILDRLDFTQEDMIRYQLKLLKWLTSCTDRRADWGRGTWWDYIFQGEESTWSEGFRKQLAASSQALVSMTYTEIDAHTYGNISTQLMLDQLGNGERTDMTLNGPTSTVWLDPWKSYLKKLGVRFFLGELVALEYDSVTSELLPVWGEATTCEARSQTTVTSASPTPATPVYEDDPDNDEAFDYFDQPDSSVAAVEIGLPTYNVLAIPLERIWYLLRFADPATRAAMQGALASSLWAMFFDWLSSGFSAWSLGIAADQLEAAITTFPAGSAQRQLAEAEARIAREEADRAEEEASLEAAKARHQRALPWLSAWLSAADYEHPSTEYALFGPFNEGPFRSMNGIQYYLESDWSLHEGHLYFPDAPWGISAISQRQFWLEQAVSGIVSVDLCDFNAEFDVNGNMTSAWDATELEAAHGSWTQLINGLAAPLDHLGNPMPWYPDPIYFHIDDYLEYDDPNLGITRNCAPFLINRPGEWGMRPGSTRPHSASTLQMVNPGAAIAAEQRPGREAPSLMWYPVDFQRWIIVGPHMSTFTRMTTMEAANESARHGANRIIHHLLYEHPSATAPLSAKETPGNWGAGLRCGPFARTWNMENDELPDLLYLKEVDRLLWNHGYPHLIEILKVEEVLDHMLGVADPEHPQHALAKAFQVVLRRETKEARQLLKRLLPAGSASVLHTLTDFLRGRYTP